MRPAGLAAAAAPASSAAVAAAAGAAKTRLTSAWLFVSAAHSAVAAAAPSGADRMTTRATAGAVSFQAPMLRWFSLSKIGRHPPPGSGSKSRTCPHAATGLVEGTVLTMEDIGNVRAEMAALSWARRRKNVAEKPCGEAVSGRTAWREGASVHLGAARRRARQRSAQERLVNGIVRHNLPSEDGQ